ncbi:MAG TPA: hypothetical protein VF135_08775 [Terriglobales bacterium]
MPDSGTQKFKADCAPIYEPLLGQALLDPEPETVAVVHRVFLQILNRLLDKHLNPEEAAEARESMTSLREFLEYLKSVEEKSVIFPHAVASLRQWLFREELDPVLKGHDLDDFGFLWLDPLETAAFCSHLVRRIAATDEAAGERIHNLAPDAKIKLLLEMARQFQMMFLAELQKEVGKDRFDAATEAGAKELYELNTLLQSPIGFLVSCKERFVRAHLRELVKHQSQSKH